jgi:hypothetical protein
MKAINIIWCIDDEGSDFNPNGYNGPREVEIPNEIEEDDIADYLSDEYGFLVESFDIEY